MDRLEVLKEMRFAFRNGGLTASNWDAARHHGGGNLGQAGFASDEMFEVDLHKVRASKALDGHLKVSEFPILDVG